MRAPLSISDFRNYKISKLAAVWPECRPPLSQSENPKKSGRTVGAWGESARTIQVSVLGAWLPSLLWGESITTPFGFLGAIVVQSTGHQFRMLLAKTAPRAKAMRKLSGEID